MSKANETNDPKARAIDALRRAGWPKTAGRVERGESSLDDALRELRALKWPDSSEVNARVVLEALVAAERSAQTDLAHATVTIAELRAHYDALRAHIATLTAERDSVREQLRQVHAICAGAPNESAVEAVQRTRKLRAEFEAELVATRAQRNAAQATLDESLSIQSQIWDAVGGQREGESLVDAVRRVVRLATTFRDGCEAWKEDVEELRVKLKTKEASVEGKRWTLGPAQRWCDAKGRDILVLEREERDVDSGHDLVILRPLGQRSFARTGDEAPSDWILVSDGPAVSAEKRDAMAKEASVGKLDGVLSEAAKRYAETPDHLKSDDVKRRRAAFDARVEAMVDNARAQASLADIGDGAVLAAEAEYQRAIDEAREAGRAEAKAEIEERDLAVWRAFAGIRGQAHGDIVFAAEQVSRRFFEEQARAKKAEAEIEQLRIDCESAAVESRHIVSAVGELKKLVLDRVGKSASDMCDRPSDVMRWAARVLDEHIGSIRVEHDSFWAERDRARAELFAARSAIAVCDEELQRRGSEIERLRAVVFAFQCETGVLRPEWAKMRIESYEDRSKWADPLRFECRGCGRPIAWEGACSSGACGSAAPPYSYGRGGKNDPLAVVANAPTASASEGPGEAGPGCGGTETAGAGESVAREGDLATEWTRRAGEHREIAQNSETISERAYQDGRADAYAECANEVRSWRSDEAAEIERLRSEVEILKTARDKARGERDRSDDALKAIEETLLSAGVTPQGGEPLADTVRRALDGRDVRAPKGERVPQAGDTIMFKRDESVEEPGFIKNVRGDGKFDLWVASMIQPFVFGVARSKWRFRD